MLEKIQCIVVSHQGSLGLVQDSKRFSMLSTIVEFDETSTEAAHRILRTVLGNAAQFERITQLNRVSEADDITETTFVLQVAESAVHISHSRGFQWLSPVYRTTLEGMYPKLMGDGVASSYRRAMALPTTKKTRH